MNIEAIAHRGKASLAPLMLTRYLPAWIDQPLTVVVNLIFAVACVVLFLPAYLACCVVLAAAVYLRCAGMLLGRV